MTFLDTDNLDNIVSLPDSICFWICALCGTNIQANMQENYPQANLPTIVSMFAKGSSVDISKRIIFCSDCAKDRSVEVYEYIDRIIFKALAQNESVEPKL